MSNVFFQQGYYDFMSKLGMFKSAIMGAPAGGPPLQSNLLSRTPQPPSQTPTRTGGVGGIDPALQQRLKQRLPQRQPNVFQNIQNKAVPTMPKVPAMPTTNM